MSLFGDYASTMTMQDRGSTVQSYSFSRELIKRIRVALLNSDEDDEEAEFLIDQINLTYDVSKSEVDLNTFIAHHLYDYLQGKKL